MSEPMDKQQIETMLDLHRKWLYDEPGGERANLEDANLEGANLWGANLWGANLWGANLRGANLEDANLRGANLRGANLEGANLWGANLWGANLWGANLRGANLEDANLRGANLRGANLWGANLEDANLRGANLWGANLEDALNASLVFAQTCVCPQKGAFIGFKKAYYGDYVEPCIVELEIPADAKRSNATGRKCRASKARVVSITDLEGQPIDGVERVFSRHDKDFTYSNGVTVEPKEPFKEDRWDECASGIHFFITREEAVAW